MLDPLGGYGLRLDSDGNIRLFPNAVNDFGKEMGYQKGDVLVSFNGKKITADNAGEIIGSYISNAKSGQKLKVVVKRWENGSFKTHKLKGKLHPVTVLKKHVLTPDPEATPGQLKLRKAWINK
jgi:membrane-associated protease RseP (regulator of RpoE activity)